MGDFEKGCIITVTVIMLFVIGVVLGVSITSNALSNSCKTYGMAVINSEVYICTPRGDK